jgi:TonB family protein
MTSAFRSRWAAWLVLLGIFAPCAAFAQAAGDIPRCNSQGLTPSTPANPHTTVQGDYPLLSIVLHEEGRTVLTIVVNEDGTVGDAKVSQSSGSLRLDDAAATLVKQRWLYTPALSGGKPVACQTMVAVLWRITEDSMLQNFKNMGLIITMKPEDYPPDARAKGEQGYTVIRYVSTGDGKSLVGEVVHSSGYADLDSAAVRIAAAKVHLAAGDYDGKRLPTMMMVIMVWTLQADTPK